MLFPDPDLEIAIHQRMLARRGTAPTDLALHFLTPMVCALRLDLSCTVEEAHDSAVDALFVYIEHPHKFEPRRGRLSSYLMGIAKRKFRRRRLARWAERKREERFLRDITQSVSNPSSEIDREFDASAARKKVERVLPDKTDQQLLSLVLSGERSWDTFARVLGLTGMSRPEQRIIVKRHLDRLQHVLKRLAKDFP